VSASRLTDIGTGSGERATADAGCGGDLRLPRRLGLNWQCVRSFMHRRHAGLPLHFRCRSRHLTQALEIAGAVSGGTGFTVRGQCLRWPRWLELNKHAVRSVVRLGHTGGPLHLRRRCCIRVHTIARLSLPITSGIVFVCEHPERQRRLRGDTRRKSMKSHSGVLCQHSRFIHKCASGVQHVSSVRISCSLVYSWDRESADSSNGVEL
jgi:hypothetical protein